MLENSHPWIVRVSEYYISRVSALALRQSTFRAVSLYTFLHPVIMLSLLVRDGHSCILTDIGFLHLTERMEETVLVLDSHMSGLD